MHKDEYEVREPSLDLAFDCVPAVFRGENAAFGREDGGNRAMIRRERRETAGWELTRNPVYEN